MIIYVTEVMKRNHQKILELEETQSALIRERAQNKVLNEKLYIMEKETHSSKQNSNKPK